MRDEEFIFDPDNPDLRKEDFETVPESEIFHDMWETYYSIGRYRKDDELLKYQSKIKVKRIKSAPGSILRTMRKLRYNKNETEEVQIILAPVQRIPSVEQKTVEHRSICVDIILMIICSILDCILAIDRTIQKKIGRTTWIVR